MTQENKKGGESNLLPFNRGRLLTHNNFERSTCYIDKLEALGGPARLRVEALENALVLQRIRAANLRTSQLHLPDSRFDDIDGIIWYHFSVDRGVFILADFELKYRHNGWGGSGSGHRSGFHGAMIGVGGCGTGIAALLASRLGSMGLDDVAAELTLSWNEPYRSQKLIAELMASHAALFSSDSVGLPEWSLLRRLTRAPQELDNAYARSIFAGEALCKIGLAVGSGKSRRALLWGPITRRPKGAGFAAVERRSFFRECVAILDAVRDGGAQHGLGQRTQHYVTASLMDCDMMGDVRRLSLIRSEMTFRMAIALAWQAARIEEEPRESCEVVPELTELLRKFALLSDFARLSEVYFLGQASGPAGYEVVDELEHCTCKKRPLVKAMVRDLDDFGLSTRVVVEQFTPHSQPALSAADLSHVHNRLRGIAREILIGGQNMVQGEAH